MTDGTDGAASTTTGAGAGARSGPRPAPAAHRETGAGLLVRCLEEERVSHVFGVPGEENIDVLDEMCDSPVRFVPTRHESGAAFIANVMGRLTGRAGVCLATLGPGATNMLTGVADATQDFAPVVAITGQTALRNMHKESHQSIDTRDLYRPVTKWSVRVLRPDTVPEIMGKAFRVAEAEKPGAVHVELPEDVAEDAARGAVRRVHGPATGAVAPAPSAEAVRQAAAAIRDARNPVILAGNGVFRSRATEPLRAFARALGIPVANTFMAKGVLPWDDPLSLLTVGMMARDYAMQAFEEADLVVTVGYDPIEYAPERWNPGGRAHVVHVAAGEPEADVDYPLAASVVGDVGASLERLAAEVGTRHAAPAASEWRRIVEAHVLRWNGARGGGAGGGVPSAAGGTGSGAAGMHPRAALAALQPLMERGATVVSDVGAHKMWVARHLQTSQPNTVLISNGFASMGIAVPGAIGAKLARPDRPAIALCGDGGFLMTCMELETARRIGVPVVVIVWVDHEYGLITWKQEVKFGRSFGIGFGDPDFAKLAEAFGAHYALAGDPETLADVAGRAIGLDRSTIVEVPVDYSANVALTAELQAAQAARV